jgi:hypothetical protein
MAPFYWFLSKKQNGVLEMSLFGSEFIAHDSQLVHSLSNYNKFSSVHKLLLHLWHTELGGGFLVFTGTTAVKTVLIAHELN